MPKSINKLVLLGNAGKDPEIRATQSGLLIATFSIATTEGVKNKQTGKYDDVTTWHNVTAFGRTAEIIRDYVNKGSKVHVEAKLRNESWDDAKTGEKKYRTGIIVNELILLDGPKQKQQGSYTRNEAPADDFSKYTQAPESNEITDDDIPF